MAKPSLPQGTRDFGPDVVRKRNYILSTIKNVFELYGFQPLETPAMENIETLMGKYGEEGDKLIFKILNNGLNDPKNIDKAKIAFENVLKGKNDKDITERALKYDLTIPFARYVAMNHQQLTFPFKRYQIQPVWRADRPQRGRYREFYQCDADVVGSNSLMNEVELANIYATVFERLKIPVKIKINSRNILQALILLFGIPQKGTEIIVAIDKLEKIGIDKVKEELLRIGLSNNQIHSIEKYLLITGTNHEKLLQLKILFGEKGHYERKGIQELEYLVSHQIKNLTIDFTLARGLNYYTGIIFEVTAPTEVKIGSIGGGGRYDHLTALFGASDISGVGISFGVDRIYDVMEELDLFPKDVFVGTQVLFFNLGEKESTVAFQLMQQLRNKNIRCELYHEQAKFDKQFKYAEKKNIPYVIIIGEEEIKTGSCKIKNIITGTQKEIPLKKLPDFSFI